jgi:hypothetical protein
MKTRSILVSCTLSVALLGFGCGNSSGSGGGAGAGGAANGTGGSSGQGGNQSVGSCNIACLNDVVSQCVPSGACTTSQTGEGACYANGVKIDTTAVAGTTTPSTTTTVTRPDGNVCYSIDQVVQPGSVTLTYKDAAGATIATGTAATETSAVTITCNGMTFALTGSGCPGASGQTDSSNPGCSAGTCTF